MYRSLNDERYNSSQLEGTITDLRRELSSKAEEKAIQDERVASLEGELAELMGQMEELIKEREERENASEDILAYQSKIQTLQAELEVLKEHNVAQKSQEAEIVELTLKLEGLTNDNKAVQEANARMETELQTRASEIEGLHAKIASLESELAENLAQASNADTSELHTRLEEMNKEKEQMIEASAKLEAELTSASTLVEEAIVQKETAEKELADVLRRVAELEAATAAATAASATADARAGEEIATLKAQISSLQAQLQSNQSAKQAADQMQRDEQLASMATELERVKDSLAAERRRSTQLEQLAASRSAGNKKLDDDQDMEAAALAGGSAFKPLVGVVRSLPPVLGNNSFVNEAAKKLDKASVALDARPAMRAAVIGYIVLLHVLLLI